MAKVKASDYSEEEKDAVIDAFDLGFMRNKLKASDRDMESILDSISGQSIVFRMRVRALGSKIVESLKRKG